MSEKLDRNWWREQGIEACMDRMELMGARLSAPQPSSEAVEAWLVIHGDGSKEVVLSPLTDATFIDEGEEAWPLYRALPQPSSEREVAEKCAAIAGSYYAGIGKHSADVVKTAAGIYDEIRAYADTLPQPSGKEKP